MSGSVFTPRDPNAESTNIFGTALAYRLHTTGIHEFQFLVPSLRAVDLWADQLEKITRATPPESTMRYIFDLTEAGMIPFTYANRRVQAVLRGMTERPKTRAVVIHPPNFMIGLVDAFVQMLQMDSYDVVRCFRVS